MPKSCLFVGQYGPKVCPTSKPQTGNGLLGYDIVDPTMIHHPVQAALAARLHWKWTLWPRGARDHRECDPVHLLRNWTTRGKAREKRDMSHKTRGEHFRIGFKKVPCPRYFMTWKHDYFFTSIFCHEWGICANHCLPAYFFTFCGSLRLVKSQDNRCFMICPCIFILCTSPNVLKDAPRLQHPHVTKIRSLSMSR